MEVEPEPEGILLAHFQVGERGADRVALLQFHQVLGDAAVARCGHAHGRLVGFHVHHVLVGLHVVTHRERQAHDGGLGDRLAKLGHDDRPLTLKPLL